MTPRNSSSRNSTLMVVTFSDRTSQNEGFVKIVTALVVLPLEGTIKHIIIVMF